MEDEEIKKSTWTSNPFSVDATDFFYNARKTQRNVEENKPEILTEYQQALVSELLGIAKAKAPDRAEIFEARLNDLENLSEALARFPSLMERNDLTDGVRTPDLLIDSIMNNPDMGNPTMQLPSKATLGKGFLVAKTHTFSSLKNLSEQIGAPDKLTQQLNDETVQLMFSLLAEDVYLNLIRDKSLPHEARREWALSLLLLWEHWTDEKVSAIAPVLQKLWSARRLLAPTFGTMVGTSELLRISFQMDEDWLQFIKQKLGTASFSQAMEEFLFGISYEQIVTIREILKEQAVPAIGRDEVSSFINETVIADTCMDYRDFYFLYTLRRDNARARKSLNLPGPHNTIEDYFVQFISEQRQAGK